MKILVGYDRSNACKDALKVAITHAKAFDAEVHVVASMNKGTEDEQVQINDVGKELDQIKAQTETDGVQCEIHLLIRGLMPGEDLVAYAKEKGIEEIVIGVKRRSQVSKLVFGSTAQFVILHAPCPVLTVK